MMESAFAIQTAESIPDLPSTRDIEPATIDEIERQQTERFFDFQQFRVPQIWQTAFQADKREVPPAPKKLSRTKGSLV
jgi:hypothetical protein